MSRPMWLVALIKASFPGRHLPARMTKLPVVGTLADRWLFANDDLLYLPRDRAVPVNRSLSLPEEAVLPSQVVEHFVRKAHFHWVMNACLCRDASHCRDYPVYLGCLFLGQAAMDINPQLGRRVSMDEALEHARRCREAGLVHLVGRNKLDTVWLGVGPGERLLTICNCCPCCCLWRVLPDIAPKIGRKVSRMPGVTVSVTDGCTGCGLCAEPGVCFVRAVRMNDGKAAIGDECRGCGKCVTVCPYQAIELTLAGADINGRAIDRLAPLVDVT